ncbi:hypothetical protein GJAV_G00218940 [Gymnothorax javanicus]|nr:hypothetical protein GJAV_G00218940 [Gymnothorax javanicus]
MSMQYTVVEHGRFMWLGRVLAVIGFPHELVMRMACANGGSVQIVADSLTLGFEAQSLTEQEYIKPEPFVESTHFPESSPHVPTLSNLTSECWSKREWRRGVTGEEAERSRRPRNMAAIQNSSSSSAPPPSNKRFLIFFDFDETIVDESSDDVVVEAAPGQKLPGWLKDTYRPGHYNEYMQRVLAFMAEQGVSEGAIRSVIEKIPASPGMKALFQFLSSHSQDFEIVLVSDANMFFIESWLHKVGARQLFLKIFTNPASFDGKGRLRLGPYHSHDCPRCPENMCKQVIVREYVAQRAAERGRPFQRVFYVGDGANDFCPSLVLGARDVAFPRREYPMHTLIAELTAARPAEFQAAVVPWESGEDVVDRLKKLVEER